MPARRNNFDLLRLGFATTVALVHAHVLSGAAALAPLSRVLSSAVAVNGFFAISGFLITASHQRSATLADYAEKRVRRIVPGYVAVVIATAALGVIVTDLPPAAYLRDAGLWRYLAANLSFLNFLAPSLPGVFAANPTVTAVNGALWSIRVELLCYAGVPLLFAATRWLRPAFVLTLALAACGAIAVWLGDRHARTGQEIWHLLQVELPVPVAYFLCGAAARIHFAAFERHARALLAVSLLCVAARWVPALAPLAEFVLPAALSVIVLYVALELPSLGNFARYGDLSYGIYVWHFPVIQLLVALGLFAASPFAALALALGSVGVLALLSWHGVERPFLRRDSHYKSASARPGAR
jgi:peptidoglycan/LPS O-acetylase OafA/YrhL